MGIHLSCSPLAPASLALNRESTQRSLARLAPFTLPHYFPEQRDASDADAQSHGTKRVLYSFAVKEDGAAEDGLIQRASQRQAAAAVARTSATAAGETSTAATTAAAAGDAGRCTKTAEVLFVLLRSFKDLQILRPTPLAPRAAPLQLC